MNVCVYIITEKTKKSRCERRGTRVIRATIRERTPKRIYISVRGWITDQT